MIAKLYDIVFTTFLIVLIITLLLISSNALKSLLDEVHEMTVLYDYTVLDPTSNTLHSGTGYIDYRSEQPTVITSEDRQHRLVIPKGLVLITAKKHDK